MALPMDDRPEWDDADDPANQADAMGEGISPDEYFADLNQFLNDTAQAALQQDLTPKPEDEDEEPSP